MKKTLFLVTGMLLFILGCDKDCDRDDHDNQDNITQAVVFEYEYTNHAWGYSHFGWLIDENGTVKGYSIHDDWKSADDEGYISKSDLLSNSNLTDTVYFQVDNDLLLEHFENRFEVLQGNLESSDQNTADAGTGALYLYVWDVDEGKYYKQLLASHGDMPETNTHPKVQSMVDWLEGIGAQTDRFFWGL